MSWIGKAVRRKEDGRFLTGKGRYTDDIVLPDMTFAVFVRSPMANAKITGLDTSDAEAVDGVIAVYTGADLASESVGSVPCGWQITSKDGSAMVEPPHPAVAVDTVRYVGDIVAIVVAETKNAARQAAGLVDVDYEAEPAVPDLATAMAGSGGVVHPEAPDNVCFDWHLGETDPVDAAFAAAAHVVEMEIHNQRLVPNAMEPRASIGQYEAATDMTTLYTTSQNPHLTRLLLGAFVLGIPEHKLRVVAPDVGGGFGSKIFHYAEEVCVTWAARKLQRPVKWTATRTEAFQSDAHGRDHISTARMALDADGRFLGLHVSTNANMGAYLSTFAPAVPTWLYGTLLAGVYKTPAVYVETKAWFTNTAPVDAYRGAGHPEATYLLERLVDQCARQLGMDRLEIRRLNMITPDMFPYQTPVALEYDIGDYQACMDAALEASDWAGFPARKAESASRGMLRGIGISTYVEACGIAPSALVGALGARAGLYESATIRVHPTGSVTVFTGTHSHGQGHETAFAQLVAEAFGIDIDAVNIDHGDTSNSAFGMGTYGSRSLSVGGSAIRKAADKIVDKGKKIAAHLMEADVDDVEFTEGNFRVKGTDREVPFGQVALTAYVPHNYPIETLEPGLEESAFYDPKNFTFPGGAHVIEVELDPETGFVTLCNVTVADDVGTVVNPMIVEGQIHGGLAQGIGQALFEGAQYDANGQLVTASYMNYTMPRAADFPFFNAGIHVTPCTHNPLGAKDVGEVGSIGVPPAVINAVLDALRPHRHRLGHPARRGPALRRGQGRDSRARAPGGPHRRRPGPQPRHHRRRDGARRAPGRLPGCRAGARRHRAHRPAADPRRRVLRGPLHDGARGGGDHHLGQLPHPAEGGLREVPPSRLEVPHRGRLPGRLRRRRAGGHHRRWRPRLPPVRPRGGARCRPLRRRGGRGWRECRGPAVRRRLLGRVPRPPHQGDDQAGARRAVATSRGRSAGTRRRCCRHHRRRGPDRRPAGPRSGRDWRRRCAARPRPTPSRWRAARWW